MFKRLQYLDDMIIRKMPTIHTPLLNKIMATATHLGSGALIWWLTLCLPFVISEKYRLTGFVLIVALGVTFVSGEYIIKRLTCRVRPSCALEDSELIVKRPKDYSFPSGHTASSFTAFTVVLLRCPAFIFVPVFIVACIISFSRMYLRVHYLSDVLAGVMLGAISGSLCVFLSRFFV